MLMDFIVIAFLCLSVYLGYKRGLVRTISKLLCLIVSVITAKILHPYISGFLRKTIVGDFINSELADKAQMVTDGSNPIVKQVASGAVESLTDVAVTVVTIVTIIIIVFIFTSFIVRSLNLVTKLPFVSAVNKFFGTVAGLFMGLITIYLVLLAIAVINIDASWLEDSVVAAVMFEDNIIMNLIF